MDEPRPAHEAMPVFHSTAHTEGPAPAPPRAKQEMEGQDNGGHDTETPSCRICRGEELPGEPLFYPCKCNGSIRYVHQECLMEWLARSQKRHCELCKTPFRFTKLYDPHMPSSVPMPVFIKQATKQVGQGILLLLRYALVAFVWLAWVPWTMRTMWRFLFWLGDGAWLEHRNVKITGSTGGPFAYQSSTNGTLASTAYQLEPSYAASAVSSNASTSSYVEYWYSSLHDFLLPWTFQEGVTGAIQRHRPQSVSFLSKFVKRIFHEGFVQTWDPAASNITRNDTAPLPDVARQGTMLSDVKYLQSITRWPALNRTIMDVLEGQLITLFVMTLIVLVFLIREWVVQQQPNLNVPRIAAPELAIEQDPAREQAHAEVAQLAEERNAAQDDIDAADTQPRAANLPESSNAATHGSDATIPQESLEVDQQIAPFQRPPMPRDALDRASELRRVLEEERTKVGGDMWPGVQTFMHYWNHGDCQPQKVLDLIAEENREVELAWIVQAMQRLKDTHMSAHEPLSVEQMDALAMNLIQNVQESGNGSDKSWQVLDDAAAEQIEDAEPPAGSARIASNVPVWLEDQDLTWTSAPTADKPELDDVPQGDDATSTEISDGAAVGVPGQAQNNEQLGDQTRAAQIPDAPAQNQPEESAGVPDLGEAETARVGALGGEAVHATFWDRLANLIWPHVELPLAEQQQVANQLEPILQPEADHEQAVPPPPAFGPGNGQEQEPVQRPAAPVAPAAPDQGPAPEQGPDAGQAPFQDPEVLRAAREAGANPEEVQAAIDDGDDLEGLVELIGLQGPLLALVQHGMVCGAIVTLVVFFGIWVPYIVGKVVLVFLSNPFTLLVKMPLRWTSFIINVLIDAVICMVGNAFFRLDQIIRALVAPVGWLLPLFARMQQNTAIPDAALSFAAKSADRLVKTFTAEEGFSDSDIPYFSVIAHESLVTMEEKLYNATVISYYWVQAVLESPWTVPSLLGWLGITLRSLPNMIWTYIGWESIVVQKLLSTGTSIIRTNPFKLRLDFPPRTHPFDLELIEWSTRDRILAIMLGYFAFYMIGASYVKMRQAMRHADTARDEALEILSQAGGVLKVILVITIEMIAFPLYCGLLLDVAMLPLFQDQSLLHRLKFAVANPLTSTFLHWFVGTCYMFHFALFVSMCRKTMRKGVLYFIRDPDDPTFHPVRDVLERNLMGQLRKILFSAAVYGALVIVCLGAVVWGVASMPVQVLPIKWSTLHPTTELPVNLIVLNFLIPVAIRVLDPSQGLEAMYKWWFKRCARTLRLSHFIFGDRQEDEEGYWVEGLTETGVSDQEAMSAANVQLTEGLDFSGAHQQDLDQTSEHPTQMPTPLLEKDDDSIADNHNAMRMDFLKEGEPISQPDVTRLQATNKQKKPKASRGRKFIQEGRFVRAPGSDQVRIPRSHQTFIRVDGDNNRLDGQAEPVEGALHAKDNKLFQLVWLPPQFPLRIGLFIFLLWTFAAVTGLGMTIVPLCFGRYVLGNYLPSSIPVNDLHAFCLGAYALDGPIFLAIKYHEKLIKGYQSARLWIATNAYSHNLVNTSSKAFAAVSRAFRVLYFYSFFGIVMPTLLAAVLEFYVFIPLTTHANPKLPVLDRFVTVSFIQTWTVGVLYLRIIGRVIHNNQESRPARALFALVAPANHGSSWWDPDVKLATRAFFLPAAVLVGTALTAPLLVGYIANSLYFRSAAPEVQTIVYRFSYPAVAISIVFAFFARTVVSTFRIWRRRIRDEVYLIGEELHNFGERKATSTTEQGIQVEGQA